MYQHGANRRESALRGSPAGRNGRNDDGSSDLRQQRISTTPRNVVASSEGKECDRCRKILVPPEPTARYSCCDRLWHAACVPQIQDARSVAGDMGILHHKPGRCPSCQITSELSPLKKCSVAECSQEANTHLKSSCLLCRECFLHLEAIQDVTSHRDVKVYACVAPECNGVIGRYEDDRKSIYCPKHMVEEVTRAMQTHSPSVSSLATKCRCKMCLMEVEFTTDPASSHALCSKCSLDFRIVLTDSADSRMKGRKKCDICIRDAITYPAPWGPWCRACAASHRSLNNKDNSLELWVIEAAQCADPECNDPVAIYEDCRTSKYCPMHRTEKLERGLQKLPPSAPPMPKKCGTVGCFGDAVTEGKSSQPFCRQCLDTSPAPQKAAAPQLTEAKKCADARCSTLIGIYDKTSIYCTTHRMQHRFEKAMENKKQPPAAPRSESRPLKKAKLHRLNQEGKDILREQRANPSLTQRGISTAPRKAMVDKSAKVVEGIGAARKSAPTRNIGVNMTPNHTAFRPRQPAQYHFHEENGSSLQQERVASVQSGPDSTAMDGNLIYKRQGLTPSVEKSSPSLDKKRNVAITSSSPPLFERLLPNFIVTNRRDDLQASRSTPQVIILQTKTPLASQQVFIIEKTVELRDSDSKLLAQPQQNEDSSSLSEIASRDLSSWHHSSDGTRDAESEDKEADVIGTEKIEFAMQNAFPRQNRSVCSPINNSSISSDQDHLMQSFGRRPLALAPMTALKGLSSSSPPVMHSQESKDMSISSESDAPSSILAASMDSDDISMSEVEEQDNVAESAELETLDETSVLEFPMRDVSQPLPVHSGELRRSSHHATTPMESSPRRVATESPGPSLQDCQLDTLMNTESSDVDTGKQIYEWHTTLPMNSLERVRVHKTSTYNPADLDSWLHKSSLMPDDAQHTTKELLETQIWDELNPRTAWPEILSESWIEDKRKEIKARGGRKKNFGRILTEQVMQEKRENGWSLFQNKAVAPINDMQTEIVKGVDDLFRLKNVEATVPAVRNGVLCMVQVEDESERRKRGRPKSASKSYQFG